jgi:hypothetical protein
MMPEDVITLKGWRCPECKETRVVVERKLEGIPVRMHCYWCGLGVQDEALVRKVVRAYARRTGRYKPAEIARNLEVALPIVRRALGLER